MRGVALTLLLVALSGIAGGCGSGSNDEPDDPSALTAAARYDEVFTCLRSAGLRGIDRNAGRWPRLIAMTGDGPAVVNARVYETQEQAGSAEAAFRTTEAANREAGFPPSDAIAVSGDRVFATYSGFADSQAATIEHCVSGPG